LFFSGRPRKCSQAEAAAVEAVGVAVVADVPAAEEEVVDPAEAEALDLAAAVARDPAEECPGPVAAAAPDPAVVESQGRVVVAGVLPLAAGLAPEAECHPVAERLRSVNRVAAPAPRNCRPVVRM
jgi:hypothetical protein